MLCLSRRINERINIGENIQVVVCGIQGDRVRLGILAPKDVRVDRDEVTKRRDGNGPAPPQAA